MDRSSQSNTVLNAVRDIDTLELCMVDLMGGDMTMLPQMHALACYMVLVCGLNPKKCLNRFRRRPEAVRTAIGRLLDSETAFMDLEPRALGIDLVSYTTAEKMQQSLDVKHYRRTKNNTGDDDETFQDSHSLSDKVTVPINVYRCAGRKIPNIKPNHLFTDKEYVWLRWYRRPAAAAAAMPTRATHYIVEYLKFAKVLKINEHRTVDAYKIIALDKRASAGVTAQYKHYAGTDIEADTDPWYASEKCYTFVNDGYGRFMCTRNRATMDNLQNFEKSNDVVFIVLAYHRLSVFSLGEPGLYESYISKTNKRSDAIKTAALLDLYDTDPDCSLVFLSELAFFRYNVLLFISNYVKFMYCNANNRNVFDPGTYEECRTVQVYMSTCCLFLSTTNLSNMSEDTHGPLMAYTAERPKILLSKLARTHRTFVNEGVRAMQSVNLASDVGARSNLIEVSGRLYAKQRATMTTAVAEKHLYQYYDMSILS